MSKYDSLKHAKFRIRYHIILSTKYRRPLLTKVRDELNKELEQIKNNNIYLNPLIIYFHYHTLNSTN